MDASPLEQDTVLREVVDRLVAELQPERIYLFGSRARGDARPDSDYDLLVVVKERTGKGREMEQRAYGAMWGLHAPVEIVVMTADYFDWMLAAAASRPVADSNGSPEYKRNLVRVLLRRCFAEALSQTA